MNSAATIYMTRAPGRADDESVGVLLPESQSKGVRVCSPLERVSNAGLAVMRKRQLFYLWVRHA